MFFKHTKNNLTQRLSLSLSASLLLLHSTVGVAFAQVAGGTHTGPMTIPHTFNSSTYQGSHNWTHVGITQTGGANGQGGHIFHHHNWSANQSNFTGTNNNSNGSGANTNPQTGNGGRSGNPGSTTHTFYHQWVNTQPINVVSGDPKPKGFIMVSGDPKPKGFTVISGDPKVNYAFTHNHGSTTNANGPVHTRYILPGDAKVSSGTSLDLTSSQTSLTAQNTSAVQITIGGQLGAHGVIQGGTILTIQPGQAVTAAQYVAVSQIMTTGHQSLLLAQDGTASGGLITLTSKTTGTLASLDVPKSVTVDTIGFTASNPLVVSGSSQILGSVIVLGHAGSVLDFSSLDIGSGGVVSNVSLNNHFSGQSLSLDVLGSLVNDGTISSSGTLNLNVGTLANQTTASTPATITAPSINIYSSTGAINNSGNVSATAGNLNINTAPQVNIAINNQGGNLQATGALNLRDAQYTGASNTNITGGNLSAQSINFNSGTGTVNVNADNVVGTVNINAGDAHVMASTPNLDFGTVNVSGDPTFYNASGSIFFSSLNPTHGADLAIVAAQDVEISGGNINTTSASGNGGNLYIVAGADFVSPTNGAGELASGSITIDPTQGSATGGAINLTGVNKITTAGNGNGNGGNIDLIAYSGSGAGSALTPGTITIPSSTNITTGGSGTGTNGSVTMLAGATTGTAITAGNITTGGGTGSVGGTIAIGTAAPSGTGNISWNASGNISGGTFVAGPSSGSAAVSLGNLNASGSGGASASPSNAGNDGSAGGIILLLSSGDLTIGSLEAYGGGGSGGTGQNNTNIAMPGGNGGAGGSIILSSGGIVSVSGDINTSGGGGGGGGRYGGNTAVGGNGGDAGSIFISAPTSVSVSGPILAAGGGGGAGGFSGGYAGGGGSFGGGGGGAGNGINFGGGAGGGGIFGGGGGGTISGAGGGINGGGANGGGGGSPTNGKAGLGGNSNGFTGGNFGAGGAGDKTGGNVGEAGPNGNSAGGAGGLGGAIQILTSSLTISNTVKTQFSGSGFNNSPFAKDAVYANSSSASSPTGGLSVQSPVSDLSISLPNNSVVAVNQAPILFSAIGNLTITGAPNTTINAMGGPMLIVAGQDVTANVGTLSTEQTNGSAGTLSIIAGANFSTSLINSPLTVTGGSSTGGAIVLTGVNNLEIAGTGNGNGGSVDLIAYSNTGTTTSTNTPGSIDVSPAISTGGAGTGTNGSVLIIGGATSGTAITTSDISTGGGVGGPSGSISIYTAAPVGTPTYIDGLITSGSFSAGTSSGTASVSVGKLDASGAGALVTMPGSNGASGGAITINATGDISTNYVRSYGGGGSGAAYYPLSSPHNGGNGGNGGDVQLTSGGIISVSHGINNSGGGGGGGDNNGNGGAGGNAGNVTITADASVNITGRVLSAGGGGGGGGIFGDLAGGGGGSYGGGGGAGGGFWSGGGGGIYGGGGTASYAAGGGGGGINGGGANSGIGGSATNGSHHQGGNAYWGQQGGGFGVGGQGYFTSINGGNVATAGGSGVGGLGGAAGTGGNVSITSSTSTIKFGGINTSGGSTGNSGGNITLTAPGNITGKAGGLTADGNSGANAGNITINTPGNFVIHSGISATSNGTGNGGTVTFNVDNVNVLGTNANGSSVDVSSIGGDGGNVFFNLASINPLFVNSIGTAPNQIVGNILANGGVNGGLIELFDTGGLVVGSNQTISANGGTGNGGNIFIQADLHGTLFVLNNGTISADNNANDSGIIAFNVGSPGNLLILGTGKLLAGNYVGGGNVDPITFAVLPSLGYNYTVVQNSILNRLILSPFPSITPPGGPGGTPGSGGGPNNGPSGPNPISLFNFFELLGFFPSLNTPNDTILDEQLGTRIATDYTPTYSYYNLENILNGYVEFNTQVASAGGRIDVAKLFGDYNAPNSTYIQHLIKQGMLAMKYGNTGPLVLDRGNLVFSPKHNTTLQVKEGDIFVKGGAVLLVMETGHDAVIFDLHDRSLGGIKIRANGKTVRIGTGSELLLTRKEDPSFERDNPGAHIGYRQVGMQDLGSGIKAMTADFSIRSAFSNIQALRDMVTSQNRRERQLANALMKNTVILEDIYAPKETYKSGTLALH